MLVGAGEKLSVPVSCVEAQRWGGSRHGEPMAPSPQTASPDLRATKAQVMRARLAAGLEARADQGEVWDAVGPAPMAAAFDQSRADLDKLAAAISRQDRQTGALVAVGGRFAVLDHVSRPDVFAALFGPLVQGYALEALHGPGTAAAPSIDEASDWLAGMRGATVALSDTVGVGERVHFATARTGGTGLAHGGELIQLSVYAEEAQEGPRTRIHRPSQRR